LGPVFRRYAREQQTHTDTLVTILRSDALGITVTPNAMFGAHVTVMHS